MLVLGTDCLLWDTADAEIKIPSAENPELSKVLSLKVLSTSEESFASSYCCHVSRLSKICFRGSFKFIFSQSSSNLKYRVT